MGTIRKKQEYEAARSLRLKGYTLRAIAQEVGVDWTTVQKWVRDLPPIRHFLTEVNENDRQGVCAVCGPVEIRKNGPDKWRCKIIVAEEYQRNVQRATDRFYEYICTQVCSDCGESDPIVIQFDHTEDNKEYDVSDMVRKGYAWDTILKEIEKCDPVCANCHVRRTNQRGNFYRHVRAQCSRGG